MIVCSRQQHGKLFERFSCQSEEYKIVKYIFHCIFCCCECSESQNSSNAAAVHELKYLKYSYVYIQHCSDDFRYSTTCHALSEPIFNCCLAKLWTNKSSYSGLSIYVLREMWNYYCLFNVSTCAYRIYSSDVYCAKCEEIDIRPLHFAIRWNKTIELA